MDNVKINEQWCPDVCPITKRPFFMWIEHPEKGYVPTYGGPYDSYTLAEYDSEDDSFRCERYDHDAGYWLNDECGIDLRLIDNQREDNEYGTVADLEKRLEAADKRIAELDRAVDEELRNRDRYQDMADKLAESISEYFGVDIGEHSNVNCPWERALDVIADAKPYGEPLDALKQQEPVAYGLFCEIDGRSVLQWPVGASVKDCEGMKRMYSDVDQKKMTISALYTTPQAAPAELSDEEIFRIEKKFTRYPKGVPWRLDVIGFARAILARSAAQQTAPAIGITDTSADKRDAERYRWLRNPTLPVTIYIDGKMPFAVDSAIDASMQQAGKDGEE